MTTEHDSRHFRSIAGSRAHGREPGQPPYRAPGPPPPPPPRRPPAPDPAGRQRSAPNRVGPYGPISGEYSPGTPLRPRPPGRAAPAPPAPSAEPYPTGGRRPGGPTSTGSTPIAIAPPPVWTDVDTLSPAGRPGRFGRARRWFQQALARSLPLVPVAILAAASVSWWHKLRLQTPGAALTAAGQWTGLAAAVYALATVALMARVPLVTQVAGVDRAIKWHRWAATATMVFLTTHAVTTTLGYAGGKVTWAAFRDQLTTFVTTYPDMATAAASTALFLIVSSTSIRFIRRRFRYQTWLFIHWYSYAAVALAFGHELAIGASFVGAHWPTLLWTWLHLFVAGLVVWFRVVQPLNMMVTHPQHVASVVRESPNAVSILLQGDRLHDYRAEAGHHIRVRFLTRSGWWQSHPMSLSAAPRPDMWRITVAAAGDHTGWMQGVRLGTPVLVSGAYGHLTADRCRQRRVLLIAAGSGITPLRALLESLPADVQADVLYRAREPHDVLHADELDRLAAARQGQVHYLLGRRNPDPRQDVLSPRSIAGLVPDIASRDVYVCGLAGFVDRVAKTMRKLGVRRRHLHLERYDP